MGVDQVAVARFGFLHGHAAEARTLRELSLRDACRLPSLHQLLEQSDHDHYLLIYKDDQGYHHQLVKPIR